MGSFFPEISKSPRSVSNNSKKPRYCLWLKNVSPAVSRKMPLVMQRIEACKADRLAARDPGRRKLADTPTLFRETNNPSSAVVVPKVSSERREYVPVELIDAETIASDLVFLIPPPMHEVLQPPL